MAVKHEGLVRHKGKGHRADPRQHIAETAGQLQHIVARQIHQVVDRGGQHTEHQINQDIPMLFQ